jgi:hypothetical protein
MPNFCIVDRKLVEEGKSIFQKTRTATKKKRRRRLNPHDRMEK